MARQPELAGDLEAARAVAWAGALLMGAGCLAMLGLVAARVYPLVPALIGGLSLTGFGIGLVVTAITSVLLGSVAPAQSGIASGTFTAFRQTGSVLGVALFGTLLVGLHPFTGLEVTFAIGAGLAAVVAASVQVADSIRRGPAHGAAVLLKIYAHCIDGQADAANKRTTDALGVQDPDPSLNPATRETTTSSRHPEMPAQRNQARRTVGVTAPTDPVWLRRVCPSGGTACRIVKVPPETAELANSGGCERSPLAG